METPKQNAIATSRTILRKGGTGALSTLDVAGGAPFTTLVNIACDESLRPLILTSDLSHHSKCLKSDPRASVMLHDTIAENADPMLTFRVSLSGTFQQVSHAEAQNIFLARHPYAELYLNLGDFHFWRMEPTEAHIIAGFGRAYGVRFKDFND